MKSIFSIISILYFQKNQLIYGNRVLFKLVSTNTQKIGVVPKKYSYFHSLFYYIKYTRNVDEFLILRIDYIE